LAGAGSGSANLAQAVASLRKGRPVVVFDSAKREREADIMVHARFASAQKLMMLRKDAGGLVCLATSAKVAQEMGLPFLSDAYQKAGLARLLYARTKYGDKPAFSISVNHAGTYTGITDNDRSLSAREFARVAGMGSWKGKEFQKNFRAPGHLQLLIGKSLQERKGHTELGVHLCSLAGLPPAILMCEMLGKGNALSREKAIAYAKKKGLAFIEGKEIMGE